ncbi:hypothetical protein [Streptomyces sp. NPDC058667]|uniref:hypothetical protein n=1 Tax=Streptomyces sp. NPDC058667 TaxID=3346588 RepID=UPI00365CF069
MPHCETGKRVASAVPTCTASSSARCQPLDSTQGCSPEVQAQRKARREYENRASALAPIGP